jgi:YegS/Rv2252/BmrU family lipid kinase
MKKNILFIINPISGGLNKEKIPALIQSLVDKDKWNISIQKTEYPEHAKLLASDAVKNNVDLVVAVGGDGTVNEIASALVHTNTVLGIVPLGSGNGLARDLNIPLSVAMSIRLLNNPNIRSIDVGQINQHYFFCTAGVGFDATVANAFASMPKRGLMGYVQTSIIEYTKYRIQNYTVQSNGYQFSINALMITFANASQFGNNVSIAPLASMHDGMLDMCITKPLNVFQLIGFVFDVWRKRVHHSPHMQVLKINKAFVSSVVPMQLHADGEPLSVADRVELNIMNLALKVAVS